MLALGHRPAGGMRGGLADSIGDGRRAVLDAHAPGVLEDGPVRGPRRPHLLQLHCSTLAHRCVIWRRLPKVHGDRRSRHLGARLRVPAHLSVQHGDPARWVARSVLRALGQGGSRWRRRLRSDARRRNGGQRLSEVTSRGGGRGGGRHQPRWCLCRPCNRGRSCRPRNQGRSCWLCNQRRSGRLCNQGRSRWPCN